jgi:hypothetical protein
MWEHIFSPLYFSRLLFSLCTSSHIRRGRPKQQATVIGSYVFSQLYLASAVLCSAGADPAACQARLGVGEIITR